MIGSVWVFIVIAFFGTADQKFIVTDAEYATETECIMGGSVLITKVDQVHPDWAPTRYACVEKKEGTPV